MPAPRGVFHVTGGGLSFFPELLGRGGGSATLLSARIPYDPADLRDLVGQLDPGPTVTPRVARALAMTAFRRAIELRGDLSPDQVFGLGSTSKLSRVPVDREGRVHEIHAAIQTATTTLVQSIILPAGLDREAEERINALALLNLTARAKGVEPIPFTTEDGRLIPVSEDSADEISAGVPGLSKVLAGLSDWVAIDRERRSDGPDRPELLLPGSFRPIHEGHRRMAEIASGTLGVPCHFEVSVFHPEKPPIDYLEVADRVAGFARRSDRVLLTNAPTYRDKARLFPGAAFAVGHDTAERIVDPRFYGNPTARDAMLAELSGLGSRFLVFGRVDQDGRFRSFDPAESDSTAVAAFRRDCVTTIPEATFRSDLSSTAIRSDRGVRDASP